MTFFLAFPPELDGLSLGFEDVCFESFLGGCCIKQNNNYKSTYSTKQHPKKKKKKRCKEVNPSYNKLSKSSTLSQSFTHSLIFIASNKV